MSPQTLESLHLTDPATGEAWAAIPTGWDLWLQTKARPLTTPNLDEEGSRAEPPDTRQTGGIRFRNRFLTFALPFMGMGLPKAAARR